VKGARPQRGQQWPRRGLQRAVVGGGQVDKHNTPECPTREGKAYLHKRKVHGTTSSFIRRQTASSNSGFKKRKRPERRDRREGAANASGSPVANGTGKTAVETCQSRWGLAPRRDKSRWRTHPAPPLDDVLELLHVGRRLHEREGHHVHAPRHDQSKGEVGTILPRWVTGGDGDAAGGGGK